MTWPGSDLPIVDAEQDEGTEMGDGPRTVLITGASGNIGRKLRAAWAETYDLILLDRRPDPDEPNLVVADLATWDEEWTSLFLDADVVVHLAANPNEFSPWEDLVGPNMDALANVFLATALGGVERLIFATSNHAMGEYRDRDEAPITIELTPRPDGPYGGLKLMGERLGRSLAASAELTFVGLRIGWIQAGENRPETMPHDWARLMWLSNRDAISLFTRAVEAELEQGEFVLVNGMSNNQGMRWSLTEAREKIGFEPHDDATRVDTKLS